MVQNERGMVLVVVLMVMTLMSIMWGHMALLARLESMKAVNHKNNVKVLYLAESGANYATVALAFTDTVVITADTTSILGPHATGSVVITPDSVDPNLATIVSTATYYTSKEVVQVGVKRTFPTFPGVRGAITANGPTLTGGEIVVDGRDHDINGNVIPGQGGPGLITGGDYTQQGGSLVGGTDEGTDYVPSTPADSHVIEEGVSDLELTPDAVLGFQEGTLKQLAMKGTNGGQYVTDPANLVGPLSGVTYVEMPSDDPWWIVSGDTILSDGTGILVVHNSTTGSIIKNLNEGTFKGLIIADDVVHVHTTIIGALISLTPNPSGGNSIGNGSGEVLFSQAALDGLNFAVEVSQTSWLEK